VNKKHVYTSFFIILLLIVSLMFFKIISPFIMDIFIAAIITHFFFPSKEKINKKFSEKISGILTIGIIIFVVVIPLLTIGIMVSSELSVGYSSFIEKWSNMQVEIQHYKYFDLLGKLPILGSEIGHKAKIDLVKNLTQIVSEFAKYSFVFLKSLVLNLTTIFIHFLFTLLLTYYFLVDYNKIKKVISKMIPLQKEDVSELYLEIENTGDATIKGTFFIGLIEGTFGAVLLAIVGTPSAVLLGVIMFFLSMIPLIGITVILIPFSIYYMLSGDITSGLIILIIGISGVTFTQNLLKPKLVGDQSGLHQGVVLVSSIGGISVFGLIGFLIGPMIATLFFVIWKQFALKYGE